MNNNNFKHTLLRRSLLTVAALALSACAKSGSDGLVSKGKIAAPVSSITHYGKGIGVAEFYINGMRMGVRYGGWGGGGSFVCCISLPMKMDKPLMVTVKWKTYRTSFKEERWHEATIPVNFDVQPGDAHSFVVHFLPGHRVEIWLSDKGMGNADYPGPAYPYPPAPDYVPLPDEAPEPQQGKLK